MSEVENNPIADLVQHAFDQDYNKANQVFGDLMGQRMNDILDQKKIEVAGQIHNNVEEDEYEDDEADSTEELDTDDEELEDDESDSELDEEDEED